MKEINGKGQIVGAIAWFVLVFYAANEGECVLYESCGSWDLVLFALISIGFLAPAYLLAILVSDFFKSD